MTDIWQSDSCSACKRRPSLHVVNFASSRRCSVQTVQAPDKACLLWDHHAISLWTLACLALSDSVWELSP